MINLSLTSYKGWQHPVFARMGAMSAAALILGSFASLSITCSESNAQSWEGESGLWCLAHILCMYRLTLIHDIIYLCIKLSLL